MDKLASVHVNWFLSPYTGFHPLTNSQDHKEWMTPFMVEESEKGKFDADVHRANKILERGVETFDEFVEKYRNNGGTLLIGYLRDIYDEYNHEVFAEQEESRATGN